MNTFWTVLLIILAVAAVALGLLYYFGQKLQVRQAESQKTMEMYSQTAQLLIIDKKKMKLKEAPFPKEVYEQTPAYLRWMSVYVVKAKIGPRIFNLMCEKPIFDQLPVKSTVQAKISGAYITEIIKGAVVSEKELEKRTKANAKAAKKAEKEAKKASR